VTPKHAHFKREVDKPGETIFRYVFEQPSDPNREITLTVMAFDVLKTGRAVQGSYPLSVAKPNI
jgi:hypothetical protein